nr:MAG TPA: hypothetical protein [Caudoviricetes sp.]
MSHMIVNIFIRLTKYTFVRTGLQIFVFAYRLPFAETKPHKVAELLQFREIIDLLVYVFNHK